MIRIKRFLIWAGLTAVLPLLIWASGSGTLFIHSCSITHESTLSLYSDDIHCSHENEISEENYANQCLSDATVESEPCCKTHVSILHWNWLAQSCFVKKIAPNTIVLKKITCIEYSYILQKLQLFTFYKHHIQQPPGWRALFSQKIPLFFHQLKLDDVIG